MRCWWLWLACAACSDSSSWLVDAHVLVDGVHETNSDCRSGPCPHDENTDLTIFNGSTFLVHRTAESQVLGPNSSLRVYRSDDHGTTWTTPAIIPAPDDRDLRDPSFYVDATGALAIKAITRLPVTSERDSGVDSITIRTTSADGGMTWSDLEPIGPEMWSFWRVKADSDGTLYSAAYEDGDLAVQLFSSTDGMTWTPGAMIYAVSDDTPLETELIFDGNGNATALVRMDGTDEELLGNVGRLRTKICTAARPYTSFDCSGEIDDARLDGPVAFAYGSRELIIAREHFIEPDDRKKTALYELVDGGVVMHGEFPSAGDTSYAGVVPIEGSKFLATYYSSDTGKPDEPWARAILEPSDIWQATIDVGKL
jgi:hypothetical protein